MVVDAHGAAGTPDEPGTPGWELYLPVGSDDVVLRKSADDGFAGTDLGDLLTRRGARRFPPAVIPGCRCR